MTENTDDVLPDALNIEPEDGVRVFLNNGDRISIQQICSDGNGDIVAIPIHYALMVAYAIIRCAKYECGEISADEMAEL